MISTYIRPYSENARFTSTSAYAASPKFGFSRTVYVGSFDHNVYALNALTGVVEWQFTTGGIVFSSPTLGEPNF